MFRLDACDQMTADHMHHDTSSSETTEGTRETTQSSARPAGTTNQWTTPTSDSSEQHPHEYHTWPTEETLTTPSADEETEEIWAALGQISRKYIILIAVLILTKMYFLGYS